MTWVQAESCQVAHPYGEDGWRPAAEGHEHWEEDLPVEEFVPTSPEGTYMSLSRDGIAALGLWICQEGKRLAEFSDDPSVGDTELVYLALTLMGNLSTMSEKNGPMLAKALVWNMAREMGGE